MISIESELNQLTLNHALGQINENIQNMKVSLTEGDKERLHVKPVSNQNGSWISPFMVYTGPSPAGISAINDIVVHQGGGMDKLHDGSQLDSGFVNFSTHLGTEQQ